MTTDPVVALHGLSGAEAAAQLARDGYNELPGRDGRRFGRIAADVLREPMFALLVACGAIYLLLGDRQEALILLGFVVLVVGITSTRSGRRSARSRPCAICRARARSSSATACASGSRAARSSAATCSCFRRATACRPTRCCSRPLTSPPTSRCSRASRSRSTSARARPPMPPGPRRRRPASARRWYSPGRSSPEGKASPRSSRPAQRRRWGASVRRSRPSRPSAAPSSARPRGWCVDSSSSAIALCIVVVVAYGATRGDWLGGFLAGLTLAMAILPNEFPAVLAIFLALGAWRIAQQERADATDAGARDAGFGDRPLRRQDRHAHAEPHGGADARRRRRALRGARKAMTFPRRSTRSSSTAILASQRDPFDPMEKAFQDLGPRLAGTEHLHPQWTLVRQYPLSERLLALSHVWRSPEGDEYVIAAKGAPEAIADLCHLDEARTAEVHAQVATLATDGLRVLGVARAHFRGGGGAAVRAARLRFRVGRPRRPRRSGASRRAGGDPRVPCRRHPRRHDHRRPPAYRACTSHAQVGLRRPRVHDRAGARRRSRTPTCARACARSVCSRASYPSRSSASCRRCKRPARSSR